MRHASGGWRAVCILVLLSCSWALGAAETRPTPLPPGDHLRRLKVDGRDRSYLVHIPPRYETGRPAPVVLIFHGAWMNASLMVAYCGMNATADAHNFVAVYPNGLGFGEGMLFFNAWGKPAADGPPDDVAFTAALLDDLGTVVNVDPKRIFCTGMSNGGMMSHRIGAELADRIAAIAPVAGTLAIPRIAPSRPVPVMHFHGTADAIVPYAARRRATREFIDFRGVDATIAAWVETNKAASEPKVEDLPDRADDGTRVTRFTWAAREGGAEVVLIRIVGGGHTWPGRPGVLQRLGRASEDISANEMIWEFFERHPRGKGE